MPANTEDWFRSTQESADDEPPRPGINPVAIVGVILTIVAMLVAGVVRITNVEDETHQNRADIVEIRPDVRALREDMIYLKADVHSIAAKLGAAEYPTRPH